MSTLSDFKKVIDEALNSPFYYFRHDFFEKRMRKEDIRLIVVSKYHEPFQKRPVTRHGDKPIGDIIRNWDTALYGFRFKSFNTKTIKQNK